MCLPFDVRTKDLAEERQLGLAARRRFLGHMEDRAVVLPESDRSVGGHHGLGEVPGRVLDHRQLANAIRERRIGRHPLVEPDAEPGAELSSPRGEDPVQERVAADRRDRLDQAQGQSVVVHREEVLRIRGHVIAMPRPPNPVALDLVGHEPTLFEGVELLEDSRPAGPEVRREDIGRHWAALAEVDEDCPPERGRGGERGRRTGGTVAGRTPERGDGHRVGDRGVCLPDALGHVQRLAETFDARCCGTPVGCYAHLMDLDLSPEHALLRSTVREFMEKEVAPVVDEHERERRFPVEIVRRLGEMGWLGIPIPEDEGGAGLDTLAYAIAVEEISRVWGSLGLIVAAHTSLGCGPLHLAGTPEQQQEFLVPMASGKVIGGYGLTESGAGSDAGGTRTTARHEAGPDGGTWVIDGGKRFITNAGQAGTYIVTARTGAKADGSAEISAFILPAATAGFRVGRLEDKLGLHASATGELIFDGCRVPASNMLGKQGEGFRTFLKILDGGRISIAAMAVGLAQAALDAAIPYAQTREQFGKPIGSFQGVAFMIADMATEIEAARGLVWKAAWLKDKGRDFSLVAAEAKLYASEVSSRATNAAIQVHGGYGYVTDYPVERFMRDAKLTEIGEGTSQVQRLVIARRILGLRIG